ncbi:MAG: hypothetical protein AAGA18_06265 [Verrucomicrobiota bacterium]
MSLSCFAQSEAIKTEDADAKIIAEVLGQKITAAEKDNLQGLIFGALLQEFAKENKIEPTEAELDAFIVQTQKQEKRNQVEFEADRERLRRELRSTDLSDEEREDKESQLQTVESILKANRETKRMTKGMEAEMHSMMCQMAQQFVNSWKINKALYEEYGGRIIFQQAGVEPLDAYRDFLRKKEEQGAFQILDESHRAQFWNYFTNDNMHTFYDKNDGAKFIHTPWWMVDKSPEE